MARKFSKNAERMAKALGVDPEKVNRSLERSSELAAEEVGRVLNRILDDLEATSESGALLGYRAVVVRSKSDEGGTRLRKSGVKLGSFEWVAFVQASPWHQQLKTPLNVFDILDQGRPTLPGGRGVYPLWGADPARVHSAPQRVPAGGGRVGGRFSVVAEVDRLGAIRGEPRSPNQRHLSGDRRALVFREGPIKAVDPLNLYKRAFDIARNRVGGVVDRRVWKLIYVPNREKWVK